jgi:hypothetical protein
MLAYPKSTLNHTNAAEEWDGAQLIIRILLLSQSLDPLWIESSTCVRVQVSFVVENES